MRTVDERRWRLAKRAEIDFLKRFRPRAQSRPSIPSPTREKLAALDGLKTRNAVHVGESNFRFPDVRFAYNGFALAYSYQRINLTNQQHRENLPYARLSLPKTAKVFFSFTTSGQGAVSLGLLALAKVCGTRCYQRLSPLYYETEEALSHLGYRAVDATRQERIAILDSSLMTERRVDVPPQCTAVLFDTTCFNLGDARIQRIVTGYLDRGLDVVLVRSHIKLDCLGTEYNRLGSLAFISGRSDRMTRYAAFKTEFNHWANYFGVRADLKSIYPFLRSRQFLRLSERWAQRLQQCNQRFASEVLRAGLPPEFRLQTFEHRLFAWLLFPRRPGGPTAHEHVLGRLRRALTAQGVVAKDAMSFPWDFVALTLFPTHQFPSRPGERHVAIRISIPDTDDRNLDRIVRGFLRWVGREGR